VDVNGSPFTPGDLAFFSALEPEAPTTVALDTESVAMGACDILTAEFNAGV
jgi:hypothetical protein